MLLSDTYEMDFPKDDNSYCTAVKKKKRKKTKRHFKLKIAKHAKTNLIFRYAMKRQTLFKFILLYWLFCI